MIKAFTLHKKPCNKQKGSPVFSTLLDKYGAYGLSGVFLKNREDNDFDWRKIIW